MANIREYTFDEPGWVTSGVDPVSGDGAEIGSSYGAHSLDNALAFGSSVNQLDPSAPVYGLLDIPALKTGVVHLFRAWVDADTADETTPAQFVVTNDDQDYFRFVVSKSDVTGAGWQPVELGSFVLTQPAAGHSLFAMIHNGAIQDPPNLMQGRWVVDDIEIEEVELKKWDAFNAAINVLKGINGSSGGYNANFENRVYSRLLLPSEQPSVKLPYVCLPLDQENEQVQHEGQAFTSTWSLMGYAFFEDNPESDVLNSAGGQAAAYFRDDLIRAFMSDQSLGGAAKDCSVTSIDTYAGSDGDPTSWVTFRIEMMQMGGSVDLEA